MQTHLQTATNANVFVDDASVASPRYISSVVQATIAVAGFMFGMHHVLDDKTDKLYQNRYGKVMGIDDSPAKAVVVVVVVVLLLLLLLLLLIIIMIITIIIILILIKQITMIVLPRLS